MNNNNKVCNKFNISVVVLLWAIMSSGCQQHKSDKSSFTKDKINSQKREYYQKMPSFSKGLQYLTAGNLEKASKIFNQLLFDHPLDARLHLINAFIYHALSKQGQDDKLELAKIGYEKVIKLEPDNSFAILELAKIEIINQNYKWARKKLANFLMLEPYNTEGHYNMAVAAYYLADLSTAIGSINRVLLKSEPKSQYLRAATVIYAAAGQHKKSLQYLAMYKKITEDPKQKQYLTRRVYDWQNRYQLSFHPVSLGEKIAPNEVVSNASAKSTQVQDMVDSNKISPTAAQPATANLEQPNIAVSLKKSKKIKIADVPTAPNISPNKKEEAEEKANQKAKEEQEKEKPEKDPMFIIDAMIVNIEDTNTTKKGENILENFNLTITGETATKPPHWLFSDTINPAAGSNAKHSALNNFGLSTRNISYSALTYCMNIMNASQSHVELIARPSLTAKIGSQAKFFAGQQRFIAQNGSAGGTLTDTPIGTTLIVTPKEFDGEFVILEIEIQASSIAQELTNRSGNNTESTTLTFDKTNSNMNTTIKARYDETVILGGITQRFNNTTESGVPILESIPLIQYFFSQEKTSYVKRTVVFMITPRHYQKQVKNIKAMFAANKDPDLLRFKNRYNNWYSHIPNNILTLKNLHLIFEEFRIGDVQYGKWGDGNDLSTEIERFKDFLWY